MKLNRKGICIVESAVHYDFDTSKANGCETGRYLEHLNIYIQSTKESVSKTIEIEPELKKVICTLGNKLIVKWKLLKLY